MKEVEDQTTTGTKSPIYHWRFLAFATLWCKKRGAGEATLILLCFDLREKPAPPSGSMHTVFLNELNTLIRKEVLQCPYSIYVPLLETIISQFNRAVWTFRGPVRAVEKVSLHSILRMSFGAKSPSYMYSLVCRQTSSRSLQPLAEIRV
jgi:hypothetical protein